MKKVLFVFFLFSLFLPLSAYTFEELSSSMQSSNAEVNKAREAISQSLLDLKDAKAGYSPTIDLTITGSYIGNPIEPIRISSSDIQQMAGFPAAQSTEYITLYDGQENFYYQFKLSLTQPIFTWGKIPLSVKLFNEVYEARQLQLQDLLEKNNTELSTRLAALYYMKAIEGLLSQQEEIASSLVNLATEGFENGMLLKTDVLEAKVQAGQLNVAFQQLEQQQATLSVAIANLASVPDFSFEDCDFAPPENDILAMALGDLDSILANALSFKNTNLQLLSKMENIAVYTNDISSASVNWKPDFALVVDADFSGSRFPLVETDWYRKDDWSATVTVAMKTTVWDGGKAVRDVKRTQSALSDSSFDIESARNQIRSLTTENFSALCLAKAKADYQQSLVEQLEEKLKRQQNLLDTGYGGEADCLEVELELNNARIELCQQKLNMATAYYTLEYLEGGTYGKTASD